MSVDSSLALQCEKMMDVTIVCAPVNEVAALGIVPAVKYLGVGAEPTVKMSVYQCGPGMKSVCGIADVGSGRSGAGVVLLFHFTYGAVVSVVYDCSGSAVSVECGIERAV